MRTVVGLFDNAVEAQRTIQELVGLGLAVDDIGIAMPLGSRTSVPSDARMNLRPMDVPDAGRIAAGGPLRRVLEKKDHGAAADLASTLRSFGLSSELAQRYADGVRRGAILESIVVKDRDANNVVAVMRRHSHAPAPATDRRPYDDAGYRKHFAETRPGGTYEEYEPAYKLGHQLRSDERLRRMTWEDVEGRVRNQWEANRPGTWERFKEAIRHAFSR